jgi:hypothetical protein
MAEHNRCTCSQADNALCKAVLHLAFVLDLLKAWDGTHQQPKQQADNALSFCCSRQVPTHDMYSTRSE